MRENAEEITKLIGGDLEKLTKERNEILEFHKKKRTRTLLSKVIKKLNSAQDLVHSIEKKLKDKKIRGQDLPEYKKVRGDLIWQFTISLDSEQNGKNSKILSFLKMGDKIKFGEYEDFVNDAFNSFFDKHKEFFLDTKHPEPSYNEGDAKKNMVAFLVDLILIKRINESLLSSDILTED